MEVETYARGVIRMSIARGEGKFVLLKLDLQSTLCCQVWSFVVVPVKTGWRRRSSLCSKCVVDPVKCVVDPPALYIVHLEMYGRFADIVHLEMCGRSAGFIHYV